MNFEQVAELERMYLNYTKDFYQKPLLRKKIKSLTIYQGQGNWYYLFLLDYFVCAFNVDGGVGFFNEQELREKFSEV